MLHPDYPHDALLTTTLLCLSHHAFGWIEGGGWGCLPSHIILEDYVIIPGAIQFPFNYCTLCSDQSSIPHFKRRLLTLWDSSWLVRWVGEEEEEVTHPLGIETCLWLGMAVQRRNKSNELIIPFWHILLTDKTPTHPTCNVNVMTWSCSPL